MHGVCADGKDHSYNAKDSSIQIVFEAVPVPRRVAGLDSVTVLAVAAGHNHCLCYDNEGGCYSWGFGGYGRLGHRVREPARVTADRGHACADSCFQESAVDEGSCCAPRLCPLRSCTQIQQDEDKPRKIEVFAPKRNPVPTHSILAAGGTSSFCQGVADQVFCWGKLKINGDNQT